MVVYVPLSEFALPPSPMKPSLLYKIGEIALRRLP